MNEIKTLDQQFLTKLTYENVLKSFEDLVTRKTDLLDGKTKIAKGSDGIDHEKFRKNLSFYSEIICSKGALGKYLFTPFREVIVPKPPFEKDQIEEAKKAGKIRILSVSTIQDTIFQELLIQVLAPYAEKKFQQINNNSFAYRKDKSSKQAVKLIIEYMKHDYLYVLDGDIRHFFDEIDHKLLTEKALDFFGLENGLVQKYLYRFMNVGRVPDGNYSEYKKTGKAARRVKGIPQGGVLSGLLANIFLYDFDLFVVNTLQVEFGFQYIRYADDFVLLFKSSQNINEVFEQLRYFLEQEKLVLHPLGSKTKIVDLTAERLEFLGFSISPRCLRIKRANVKKFLHRIEAIINDIPVDNIEDYLTQIAERIRPKVIGLEDLLSEGGSGYCPECHQLIQKRNWIGYFMEIDDVRLLRDIDVKIRKIIYTDFHHKTKEHLKKKELMKIEGRLLSLEKTYYLYKKQERSIRTNKISYCKCIRYYDAESKTIKTVPMNSVSSSF